MRRCVLSSFRRARDMRRWRIGLPVVAVGLLLAGCGVAHERSARSVVPDTPVGLVVGSRLTLPSPPSIPTGRSSTSSTVSPTVPVRATSSASGRWAWPPGSTPARARAHSGRAGRAPSRSLSDPSHDHGRALPRVSPARSLGEHAAARAMRSGEAPLRDGMAGEARLGGPEDRHRVGRGPPRYGLGRAVCVLRWR